MPLGQIDDDTAQINPLGQELLINTDVLVEGVHFSEKTTSPEDVGWKAITTNLSDLASSGMGEVLGITVGLIAPSKTPWSWVENVYKGMEKALEIFGGNLKAAKLVGEMVAKRAKDKGIKEVIFDRGGYIYHGRVKALAESARESGLIF